MGLILQSLVDGILIGGIYGLIAIGLGLIFGVMKIINFAHGTFMMLGMYITYWFFSALGLSPYLSIPLSALILFVFGVILQKGVIDKILDAPEHNQLLLTFGLAMVIESLALMLFSPDFRTVEPGAILKGTFVLGTVVISKTKLIAFIFSIILASFLYWFLQKTYFGKSIRAISNDRVGASLSGIKVSKVQMTTFGIGAALAAIAGTLIAPIMYITPSVGHAFILKAFVVVVLGGMGNFFGALVGGIMIGAGESLVGAFVHGNLKELATYLIFILVLLFRPTGLFGKGER